MFSAEPIEKEDKKYDILWPNWKEEFSSYSNHSISKWHRIRGFNRDSTHVAIIEGEIEYYKGILKEFLPYKEDEYFRFKKLCESVLPENSIKCLTSAYLELLEIKDSMYKNIESALKAESNFNEKERAWFDFVKWGPRGFFIDFMHDLEYVDGFENTEYYQEAVFIIKKFNIK